MIDEIQNECISSHIDNDTKLIKKEKKLNNLLNKSTKMLETKNFDSISREYKGNTDEVIRTTKEHIKNSMEKQLLNLSKGYNEAGLQNLPIKTQLKSKDYSNSKKNFRAKFSDNYWKTLGFNDEFSTSHGQLQIPVCYSIILGISPFKINQDCLL